MQVNVGAGVCEELLCARVQPRVPVGRRERTGDKRGRGVCAHTCVCQGGAGPMSRAAPTSSALGCRQQDGRPDGHPRPGARWGPRPLGLSVELMSPQPGVGPVLLEAAVEGLPGAWQREHLSSRANFLWRRRPEPEMSRDNAGLSRLTNGGHGSKRQT